MALARESRSREDCQSLSFSRLTAEDQSAYLREVTQGSGLFLSRGPPCPDTVFVELNVFDL